MAYGNLIEPENTSQVVITQGQELSSLGASLVVQRLKISLSMQGIRVRSLVWEDPSGWGAAEPVGYNYWTSAQEPASHNGGSLFSSTREATTMRSPRTTRKCGPSSLQLRKSPCAAATKSQWSQINVKNIKKKKNLSSFQVSGSKSVHYRFPKGPAKEPGWGGVGGESLFFPLFIPVFPVFSSN